MCLHVCVKTICVKVAAMCAGVYVEDGVCVCVCVLKALCGQGCWYFCTLNLMHSV